MVLIIDIFKKNEDIIKSPDNNLHSDEVLSVIRSDLEKIGFRVEKSKKNIDKIKVPVLFGLNGKIEKHFEADAYNKKTQTVIEIEAGRALMNYQFLKDLFQACMMVKVDYLVTAVRKEYKSTLDFNKILTFYDTLYTSGRLILPLKGVLIIGY